MNDQTTQLLRELADKLGTTTEYLWGILVAQAPISATVSLVTLVGGIIIGCVLWACGIMWQKALLLKGERHKDGPFALIIIGFMIVGVLSFILMIEAPSIMAGFYNPEYWALRQILLFH